MCVVGFGVDPGLTTRATHCRPAHIHQVGAGRSVTELPALIHSRYAFRPCLPNPNRLAVPIRPGVVRAASHPPRRSPDQAALGFYRIAATTRREGLPPPSTTRASWRTHTLIYLANPTTGARGICHHVVTSLGGVPRFQNAALYPQAADALAAENAERGRLPVLVIDEAHLLDHGQLELVRMLTNAEMDAASPLAVVLVGQPTLKRMMKLGILAALDQRVAVRYTLTGMSSAETASYINHHVKLAGRTETLFSDDAVALIHQTSRGYPRVVNNLAVGALLATLAANKTIVDESSARTALAELTTTD